MVLRKKEKSYALFSSILFCIVFLFLSPAELTYVFNYEGNIHNKIFFLFLLKKKSFLALVEIKSSLTDPHGVLMDWNMAAADPCSWNLITCSPDNFRSCKPEFFRNSSCTKLLQNNYITGNIPPEIGKLMKLKTLDLSNNIFSGQLHLLFLIPKIFRS
ncbi:unnamed protein product [Brassica rapa subsp. trilocularis]